MSQICQRQRTHASCLAIETKTPSSVGFEIHQIASSPRGCFPKQDTRDSVQIEREPMIRRISNRHIFGPLASIFRTPKGARLRGLSWAFCQVTTQKSITPSSPSCTSSDSVFGFEGEMPWRISRSVDLPQHLFRLVFFFPCPGVVLLLLACLELPSDSLTFFNQQHSPLLLLSELSPGPGMECQFRNYQVPK